MKLISLNTWGCRITKSIFEYINRNADSTDIFCFQEILKGGVGKTSRDEVKSAFEDIASILANHTGYFSEYGEDGYYSESSKNLNFKYGIACYIRSSLKQNFIASTRLYDIERKWNDYSGRFAAGIAQAMMIEDFIIGNVHGLWQGSIKTDTEAKIEQSKNIIDLVEMVKGRKIICGDFNMLPDTKSIQILGDKYRDLIKEHNVKNTRSSLYVKDLRYSDYIFTDRDIKIKDFSVANQEISDHLPLCLEFTLK